MRVPLVLLPLLDSPGSHWRQLVVLLMEPAVLLQAGIHICGTLFLILSHNLISMATASSSLLDPIPHTFHIELFSPINVAIRLLQDIARALAGINISRLLSIIQILCHIVVPLHQNLLLEVARDLARPLEVGVEAVVLRGEDAGDAFGGSGLRVPRLRGRCVNATRVVLVHMIHSCYGISQEFLI